MGNTTDEDVPLPLMSEGSYENLRQQVGDAIQIAIDESVATENLNLGANNLHQSRSSDTELSTLPTVLPSITDVMSHASFTSSEYRPEHNPPPPYMAPVTTSLNTYTALSTSAPIPSYYTTTDTATSKPVTLSTTADTLIVSDSGYHRPVPAPPLVRQTSTSVDDGGLNFQIDIPQLSKQTKSVAWTYSEMLKKLYIQMQTPFRLIARISPTSPSTNLPANMFLRAIPMFTEKHHRDDPVHACFNHSTKENSSGLYNYDPWMQPGKMYLPTTINIDEHGHHNLLTPWQPYATSVEMSYQFVCRNVCVGGPNRRRTSVAFVLESPTGEILARQVIEVKVSACPGRDRTNDEKAATKAAVKTEASRKRVHFDIKETSQPAKKKVYLEMDEDTYSLLSLLRDSIEMSKEISPELKARYLSNTCSQLITSTASKPTTSTQSPSTSHRSGCLHACTCTSMRPSSTSPSLVPDSSGEYNPAEDVKISEWLPSVGLAGYVDTFVNAGIINLNQLSKLGLQDFDKLKIGLTHVFRILEKLSVALNSESLSQASQSESYGLYEVARTDTPLSAQLSGYSSED